MFRLTIKASWAEGKKYTRESVPVQRSIILLKTKLRLLYLKTQFVPRSKHFSSRL
jgi:hypothetical protein